MIKYEYYLPMGNVYDTVRFLSLAPKMNGFGTAAEQKIDKSGVPIWTLSALVKRGEDAPGLEVFSITATVKSAEAISKIAELTPIKFVGLSGGKWVKAGSDRTEWSFQITGLEVLA